LETLLMNVRELLAVHEMLLAHAAGIARRLPRNPDCSELPDTFAPEDGATLRIEGGDAVLEWWIGNSGDDQRIQTGTSFPATLLDPYSQDRLEAAGMSDAMKRRPIFPLSWWTARLGATVFDEARSDRSARRHVRRDAVGPRRAGGAETLMRPKMPPAPASEGRTYYEAAAWGDLSTEELEAMRGRIDVACPDIARTAKIRSTDAGLVIEIPGIATDEQITRLLQWLLDEAALRAGLANRPADGGG
jgi:hypothetical protein